MPEIRWDPFRDLIAIQERMNRLFETALSGTDFGGQETGIGSWSPVSDMEETADAVVVRCELPGLDRDQIDIDLSGNVLTVKGERKVLHETERDQYHRPQQPLFCLVKIHMCLLVKCGLEGFESSVSWGPALGLVGARSFPDRVPWPQPGNRAAKQTAKQTFRVETANTTHTRLRYTRLGLNTLMCVQINTCRVGLQDPGAFRLYVRLPR